MAYATLGEGALDYFPCRYGSSKLVFRGPKRRLQGPYVAAIGGSETYGKFLLQPYPALIEEALGEKVVNLGIVNAGLDVLGHDDVVLGACSGATATVLQIGGAQNLSNRFYAVHPRRNDRFLRASTLLKTIYRDMDFTEFHFTRHLLAALCREDPEKFRMVENELREAWVARMKVLVSKIRSRVVLLWLSDHAPEDEPACVTEGGDPLFVNRAMIAEVLPYAAGLVEVVVSPGELAAGRAGLVYSEIEEPAALGALGTIAHERAAAALTPVLRGVICPG